LLLPRDAAKTPLGWLLSEAKGSRTKSDVLGLPTSYADAAVRGTERFGEYRAELKDNEAAKAPEAARAGAAEEEEEESDESESESEVADREICPVDEPGGLDWMPVIASKAKPMKYESETRMVDKI
jgi:hypothetical protein